MADILFREKVYLFVLCSEMADIKTGHNLHEAHVSTQLYFAKYSNKAQSLSSLVISTAHQFGCVDQKCEGQNKVYYSRIKNQMKTA